MSRVRAFLAVATVVALAACDNAGAFRTVGITATGIAQGVVYFDADGSGVLDDADIPLAGVRVRLVSALGGDTVLRATTGAGGTFREIGVPVGTYTLVVDPTSFGDSLELTRVTPGPFTLRPDDSLSVEAVVSFPSYSVSEVRAAATLGARVFVSGVALHGRETYSDTLLHVVDTSGALRATRVRATAGVAGDSVRLRGRIAERAGQRVLDDVTVFVLGATFIPTAPALGTATAATADGGALDAALVRVLDAELSDTATVAGSLRLTVSDGSGDLMVLLDRVADAEFRPPYPAGLWDAGRRFDIVGVLVPGAGGSWVLRPRTALDLTPR